MLTPLIIEKLRYYGSAVIRGILADPRLKKKARPMRPFVCDVREED